jgi:ABC-2 type transport system permease protein
MSGARLLWHQFRYDQKIFWRNPAAVFFTVMLPIIFLLIFSTIFGSSTVNVRGEELKITTYYVPGLTTLAVVSATLVSLAISLTRSREDGVLKRLRGTPAPPWAIVGGRVGNSIVVSVLMVVLVTTIGHFIYGVKVPSQTWPAIILTLVVGAASFSALGFALTSLIPTEEAAPAVTNMTVLPLYFLSGVFIPDDEIPNGVLAVASVFPIRPFFEALLTGFDPLTHGAGFELGDLAVMAAWGIGGLLVAARTFSWIPRGEAA